MTKKRKAATGTRSATKRVRVRKKSVRGAFAVAMSARKPVKQRLAALAQLPTAVCESDQNLQALLKVLRNPEEPLDVRLAALQALQAASFSVVAFASCRRDYIATLRQVAEDPELEMRQRALGMLAREKDGFAQKKLLDGLQKPEQALLPPEKALQLLSYDLHGEAYPIARAIVANPPNAAAKREALRLLAADTNAVPVFEKVLRDKAEMAENRQISAAALQALRPEKLQEHARELLLDASDYDDIQATSLTALTQFGDSGTLGRDDALKQRVERLAEAPSEELKRTARRFQKKYGQ